MRELIAALPVELRETLVLRELEELSYKEIAEVTANADRHGDVAAVAGARSCWCRRRPRAGAADERPDPARRCEKVLLVQAEFDGEIDAGAGRGVGGASRRCPVCQAAGRSWRRPAR